MLLLKSIHRLYFNWHRLLRHAEGLHDADWDIVHLPGSHVSAISGRSIEGPFVARRIKFGANEWEYREPTEDEAWNAYADFSVRGP
jgi:hypothetical protein